MTKAKISFESNLINKFTSFMDYSLFYYIKSLTKSRSLPPSLLTDTGLAESDIDKANAFNQYFYSVFSQNSVVLPTYVVLMTYLMLKTL